MAFDSWANPEVITAICAGIGTIISSILLAIKKYHGKPWKEILSKLFTTEIKEIERKIEDVAKNIQEIKNSKEKKN